MTVITGITGKTWMTGMAGMTKVILGWLEWLWLLGWVDDWLLGWLGFILRWLGQLWWLRWLWRGCLGWLGWLWWLWCSSWSGADYANVGPFFFSLKQLVKEDSSFLAWLTTTNLYVQSMSPWWKRFLQLHGLSLFKQKYKQLTTQPQL